MHAQNQPPTQPIPQAASEIYNELMSMDDEHGARDTVTSASSPAKSNASKPSEPKPIRRFWQQSFYDQRKGIHPRRRAQKSPLASRSGLGSLWMRLIRKSRGGIYQNLSIKIRRAIKNKSKEREHESEKKIEEKKKKKEKKMKGKRRKDEIRRDANPG